MRGGVGKEGMDDGNEGERFGYMVRKFFSIVLFDFFFLLVGLWV